MSVKVGVVGAGAWGKNIVRTLHEIGALCGVAEVHEGLRSQLEADYPGVPLYADPTELYESGVNAVAVAAPAQLHHALAKEALGLGLHVFVEKPITLNSADADDLVQLAGAQDCVLMVGHLLVYQPAVTFLKHFIEEGRLGRLYSLHHERLNLGRARRAENALWSLGVHDVAVCMHLVGGAPEEVLYAGQSVTTEGVDDDCRVSMRFPGGVWGHIHASWLWPGVRRRLTVVGEKGMLVYDEPNQTVTFHDKGVNPDLTNRDDGSSVVFEGAGQPLAIELGQFVECCRTGARPTADGQSGLEVVRVLEQACPVA